ncbi:MAG: cryptochrome/photolyase family protein [Pararhizobium sp.]
MGREDAKGERPAIVWFRDDLRLSDNAALRAAADSGVPLILLYILDEESPGFRPLGGARRWWLHHSLAELAARIGKAGGRLVLRRGGAARVVPDLIRETGAGCLYWNRRYAPAALAVDASIEERLTRDGVEVRSFEGALLHEPGALLTHAGRPYRVYTPFWRAIEGGDEPREPLPAVRKIRAADSQPASETLDAWNLLPAAPDWAGGIAQCWQPGERAARQALAAFVDERLKGYDGNRDRPGMLGGTSGLSPHLAFGEISPFEVWHATRASGAAFARNDLVTFRKELVWREFSYHLLFHFPELARSNYDSRFNRFAWKTDRVALKAWQKGQTGYPIVDAGMRQLWQTGWMHNRVRLVTASFLTKHLLIDWRIGEAWFWDTLVDADPASNAANWQWVAGSGADAAPYFRIFNPVLQGEKFDADGAYVRRFVPEIAALPGRYLHRPWEAPDAVLQKAGVTLNDNYPRPIIDHKAARARALVAYGHIKDAA